VRLQRFGSVVALAGWILVSMPVRPAEAQLDTVAFDSVRATPKGTIGLGLVGAELGLIIPSASGLNEVWSLTVFPVVGAAGGALAGYFALDKPGREKGSVATLAVGIAGLIPAILVTVRGVRQERQERWEPSQPIRISSKERRALELAEAGPGLLRRARSGLRMGMPAVSVSTGMPAGSDAPAIAPLRERTELRLSLASGVF
jgi:hypothetical protein